MLKYLWTLYYNWCSVKADDLYTLYLHLRNKWRRK